MESRDFSEELKESMLDMLQDYFWEDDLCEVDYLSDEVNAHKIRNF
jgi:hypothetical protein